MKGGKLILVVALVLSSAAVALATEGSLGEIARKFRAERKQEAGMHIKLYTNDNLPPPAPWEEVSPAPGASKATPSTPAAPNQTASAPTAPAPAAAQPEDKMKTKEYWQGKFSAARRKLADEKRVLQLNQDELSLLQIQQARELNPDVQSELATKIQAKQADVQAAQARVDAAQKELDDLQKEFDASGAPADWSQTEPSSTEGQSLNP